MNISDKITNQSNFPSDTVQDLAERAYKTYALHCKTNGYAGYTYQDPSIIMLDWQVEIISLRHKITYRIHRTNRGLRLRFHSSYTYSLDYRNVYVDPMDSGIDKMMARELTIRAIKDYAKRNNVDVESLRIDVAEIENGELAFLVLTADGNSAYWVRYDLQFKDVDLQFSYDGLEQANA